MAEIVDDPKIPENQVPKDQSACSLCQFVTETVDDPKVPETQVPRNRKFLFELAFKTPQVPEKQSPCGSFQEETVDEPQADCSLGTIISC